MKKHTTKINIVFVMSLLLIALIGMTFGTCTPII